MTVGNRPSVHNIQGAEVEFAPSPLKFAPQKIIDYDLQLFLAFLEGGKLYFRALYIKQIAAAECNTNLISTEGKLI